MNTVQIGDVSEVKILTRFVELGYTVLKPWSSATRYDLVIERDGNFRRVQCKTGRAVGDDFVIFNTSSVDWNTSAQKRKRDYREEIDYFAVYCPQLDRVYLVSVDDAGLNSCRLRLKPARNNQQKKTRWAADYQI